MKHFLVGVVIMIVGSFQMKSRAQNTPINETQLLYMHDTHLGLNANTLGLGGIQFRKGWHQTGSKNHLMDIEFLIVQDPKETRRYGLNDNPSQYKYGKLNNVFFLRAGYGKRIELTERPYRNAVGLHVLYSAGINMALLKPYYIDVVYVRGFNNIVVSEKFDPEKHNPYNIYGSSSFTEGLNEIAMRLGAYTRLAISVEWGQFDDEYRNIEFGCTLDAIPSGVPILYGKTPSPLFIGAYVGLNWGWKN